MSLIGGFELAVSAAVNHSLTLPPGTSVSNESSMMIELLTKAYEALKGQKQNRMMVQLAMRMAIEYYKREEYDMAKRFFDRISKSYRKENWDLILQTIEKLSNECSKHLNQSNEVASDSVIANSVSSDKSITENLNETKNQSKDIVIDPDLHLSSPFRMKVQLYNYSPSHNLYESTSDTDSHSHFSSYPYSCVIKKPFFLEISFENTSDRSFLLSSNKILLNNKNVSLVDDSSVTEIDLPLHINSQDSLSYVFFPGSRIISSLSLSSNLDGILSLGKLEIVCRENNTNDNVVHTLILPLIHSYDPVFSVIPQIPCSITLSRIFKVVFIIKNHTNTTRDIDITLKDSPAFFISGVNKGHLRVTRESSIEIVYNTVPVLCGHVVFPSLVVKFVDDKNPRQISTESKILFCTPIDRDN